MKTVTVLLCYSFLCFFTSNLTAQNVSAKQSDKINDGTPTKAKVNDVIRYKVEVKNNDVSNSASGVQLNAVPDAKTTFVNGSFLSTSVAVNDAYTCTGNVGINVPAANGVLSNDFDDNLGGATLTCNTCNPTTNGGTITLNNDGSFLYVPAAGYTGSDQFTYTINDATIPDGATPIAGDITATVTITISNMIWFIDNNSVAALSDGRRSSPFKTLASFESVNGTGGLNPAAGHTIYIEHTGTNYSGGVSLEDNQIVIGEGHTGTSTMIANENLSVALSFALTPFSLALPNIDGSRPVIVNAGGDGVTLAANNNLRGFDIGNCSDFGVDDNGNVGTLTINEVSINNATGGGIRADAGGTLAVTLGSVSSTGGANGINLGSVGGTFTANGGTISNPTGTGVQIQNGTVVFSYSGNISDNTGFAVDIDNHDSGNVTFSGNITSTAQGIQVQNCGGGTKTFSGSTKSLTTMTNNAVTLANNAGATIDFTGGGLAITTTSGMGFSATGGGTVNVTGSANTINSTGGATALNVANTNIGSSNLNFQSISSNGGTATGIILNTTGTAGGLIVNGDGSNMTLGGNSSGGTIAGKSGADGSTTSGIGIYLNNTRNVILRRMTVNGTNQNFGIRGSSVVNYTMEYCTIGGTNGTNVGLDEGSVIFTELTGSATVTNCHISGAVEHNMSVINTSGLLDRITVTGSTFGSMNTMTGSDGLLLETQGTAVINSTITNNNFTFAIGDHFQLAINSSTTNDIVFTGNTISNTGVTAVSGGGGIRFVGGSNNATATTVDDTNAGLTFNVSNNTMRDSDGTALAVNKLGGSGNFNGTIANNIIGVAGVDKSGSIAGSGIFVLCDGASPSSYTANITGNTVRQYSNYGIYMQTGGSSIVGSANMHLNISGNTVSNPSTAIFAKNGIHLNGGVVAGDAYFICLNIGINSITGTGTDGGTDFRLRQRQSTTVRLPGYAGANNNDAAVVAFVQGNIGGAPTGSAANTVPTGGGFVGGAACNTP